MSMNKPACRKFANQLLHIRPNDGLLYASQVEWLVTTAVRTIDHHRTLILYVYSREKAAQGVLTPRWTMFHTKDDYITLEHPNDSADKWRTSAFIRLSGDWNFLNRCAFVSLQDEQRVTQFFKNHLHSGFASLAKRQREIQACRSEKRKRLKQKKIALRMRTVPKVPRGLNEWVRRQVMPAYFFYDYRKGRKTTTGVCSACGQEVELTGVKHNAMGVCPHCGRELTMKANSRIGNLCDRDTCQVIQKTASDEVVVRIFKVYYDHGRKDEEISEAARKFIRQAPDGTLSCESYYCYFGEWRKGSWPTFMCYQYRFWGDACGYVYCGNLPGALKDTPWQYCPVETFYEHYHERMEMVPFLAAYRRHPKLEHLIKTGFFNLVSDLVYRGDVLCTLDETQNRTHRILGVGAEDVPFLRDLDVSLEVLRKFLSYHGLKDRQALLRWELEHDVTRDIAEILRRTTPHKMTHYLERQQAHTDPQAMGGYRTMQTLVSEYRDYLDLSEKLGDDLTSSFVLFPKNLREAHDNAAKRLKIKIDAETQRNFRLAYERVMSHLDFERNGLKIVCPASPEEIAHEGQALHHCVGSYVDRVARQECLILFLRHCDDLSTPFYTVEVRDQKAVQVGGIRNADPTPEVRSFIAAYETQVLQAA